MRFAAYSGRTFKLNCLASDCAQGGTFKQIATLGYSQGLFFGVGDWANCAPVELVVHFPPPIQNRPLPGRKVTQTARAAHHPLR